MPMMHWLASLPVVGRGRWWGRGDLNPHRIFIPNDFKSRASTDSATPPGATSIVAAF